MNFRKIFSLIFIILLLTGCSSSLFEQSAEEQLKKAIAEQIHQSSNFAALLEDEIFLTSLEDLARETALGSGHQKYRWVAGFLEEEKPPYLALYVERNPEDIGDPGQLLIMGYDQSKFDLLQQIPMNYDNANYDMVIGAVSPNQRGLLLSNEVSAHGGYTYTFYWDGKNLQPMVTDRRINLFSAHPLSRIYDIDGDGILDWSIVVYRPDKIKRNDPREDTMAIWYTWDGHHSAQVIGVDRGESVPRIDEEVYNKAKNILQSSPQTFLLYMKESIALINKPDATELLTTYVEVLSEDIAIETQQLQNYINMAPSNFALDEANINNIEYLDAGSTFSKYSSFRQFLLNNWRRGLLVNTNTNPWSYDINYPLLKEYFGQNVLEEFDDYLTIRSYEFTEPSLDRNQMVVISTEQLADRVMMTDNFIISYPYSPMLEYIKKRNEFYVRLFFFGTTLNPTFDPETLVYRDSIIKAYKLIREDHPYSFLAENINFFLDNLAQHHWKVNDSLYHYIDEEYGLS